MSRTVNLCFLLLLGLAGFFTVPCLADTGNREPAPSNSGPQAQSDLENSAIDAVSPVDAVEFTIDSYCKCSADSIRVFHQLGDALKKGDMKELQALQARMPALATKQHECDSFLREEFARRKSIERFSEKVQKGVQERCPHPAREAVSHLGTKNSG